MGGTWHSEQNPDERQKIILIVVQTLRDLQGSNFNEAAASKMAHDFEKYVFMKAPSRDDYLSAIKQKVHQMRGSVRNNSQGQNASNAQMGQRQQQPQQQQQQQQQQPPPFQAQAQAQAQAARAQQQQQQQQAQQQQSMGMGMNNDVSGQGMNFFPQNQMQMRNGMMPQQLPQQNHQQVPQAQINRPASQGMQQQNAPSQQQQLNAPAQQSGGPSQTQGMNRSAGNQLTPQQIQQLSAMIKNVPIPPVYLNKIPGLPPNVNTWARIYDLAQKKVIPPSSLPAIKEVHNAHLLIVMHQQQQRLAQRRMSNMNSGTGSGNAGAAAPANDQNTAQGNMNNMNSINSMNNMNGMNVNRQSQGLMNMQNQRMQQQQQQQAAFKNNNTNKAQGNQNNMQLPMGMQRPQQQQQQPQQNQQTPMMKQQQPQQQQAPGNQTNMGMANQNTGGQQQQAAGMKVPNFQITPQDMMDYQAEALAYLSRAQQDGKIPPNLDNNGKQSFIRKYIYHQKMTAWKNEQIKASKGSGGQMNMAQQQQQQQPQRTPQQLLMQMGNMNQGGFPQQQFQQQLNQQNQLQQLQQQPPSSHQAQQQPIGGMQQGMGQSQQSPMMGNLQQPNATPLMNQGPNQAMFSPVVQQKAPGQGPQANAAGLNAQQNQARRPQGVPPVTDEMKMKLKSLFDEVARGDSFQLKNHTMSLSDKDKLRVKELMVKINQQYTNVDHVLTYYYALTRDLGGTKKLIQMKFMTKNIIDNFQKGIYLAGPELLEKMVQHFQKYFDAVRKELTARRQQQQQQQPQAQKLELTSAQMSPAQQRPAMNQPSAQVPGQRPLSAMQPMQQGDQRFMAQNVPQNNQQNFGPPGMGQMPMTQNISPQQQHQQPPQQQAQQQAPPPSAQQHLANQRGPQQQQTQQQFARNATYGQLSQGQPDWLKAVNGPQRGANISPMPTAQSGTSPQLQTQTAPKTAAKGKKASTSGAAGRRKSTKAAGTMPTPGNSAPTPATLANAIKTPNSMPTPQVIQSTSNKGTPIDVSPNSDNKGANVMAKEPIVGDVFGANKVDSKLDKRRELSKSDPQQFFFAALSNLLETDKTESTNGTKAGVANGDHTKSPLSPNSAEWSCTVKPEAITSAFCQVDFIKDLTALEVLEECAKLVDRDAKKKEEEALNSKKREREEPDDIDLLFDESETKKVKTDDFDRFMYEPVEFDEWKQWLTGLQQTKV